MKIIDALDAVVEKLQERRVRDSRYREIFGVKYKDFRLRKRGNSDRVLFQKMADRKLEDLVEQIIHAYGKEQELKDLINKAGVLVSDFFDGKQNLEGFMTTTLSVGSAGSLEKCVRDAEQKVGRLKVALWQTLKLVRKELEIKQEQEQELRERLKEGLFPKSKSP